MSDTPAAVSKAATGSYRTDRLDPAELAAGWARIADLCPIRHVTLAVGAKTDLGCVRENNEDKFDLLEPREPEILAAKGRMYGVADGMGGHSAGQIASELALKTVIRAYYSDPSTQILDSLTHAIRQANSLIFETAQMIPDRRDMGTTLTLVLVHENHAYFAHIGDSRAYLIRDGAITQITHDHSWVAEQVSLGALTLEQAQQSPFRNIITRSIGTQPSVEADLHELELRADDLLLLCSDGLTTHIEPREILEMAGSSAARRAGPSVTTMRLIEQANERGGRDNITVLVLDVSDVGRYPARSEPAAQSSEDTEVVERTEPFLNTVADPGEDAPEPDGDPPPSEAAAGTGSGRRSWFRVSR